MRGIAVVEMVAEVAENRVEVAFERTRVIGGVVEEPAAARCVHGAGDGDAGG